ncbi:MAG: ribonuclease HII [Candidatus Aramenus sp.]|jgi:ribonuclease HII|nr:ribonuclease HII [Candidatus Aramenus sp.]
MKLGIDEAGRGPLIGPMVVAGVLLDEKREKLLKDYGVRDSKKLSRDARERLFNVILDNAEAIAIAKAFPEEIDSANLNDVTYEKVIQIIEAMSTFSPSVVTVDKVGNEEKVIKRILELGFSPNVVHKADENFIECSSASIIAKVIRDRIVESLKERFGDFGSGYPSDPKTIKWVMEVHERGEPPPPILRRSWKILHRIAPNFYLEKERSDVDGN